jgi:hypothetical protein
MRTLEDARGRKWIAELISHGQTSAYLNPRVHKPIIQFTCLDKALPRRYVGFQEDGQGSLDACTDQELGVLFGKAKAH